MNFTYLLRASVVCAIALAFPAPALACSSCQCSLTSDWLNDGLLARPGTTLSLRYDYVPQTQLRSGRTTVDRAAISLPPDREIEQRTINHYATLSVDHSFNPSFALNLQVPLSWHPHTTITEGETDISGSNTRGLGDVRISARYQGFGGPGVTGVQLGLKLPTGAIHQHFKSGPEAGTPVDRGLQPGTGTTDLVIGAYHFGKLADRFDYAVQVQGQAPLTSRDQFRPGASANFSAGIHYEGWAGITPQLQLNFKHAAKDTGANADRANSGGEQLYVSPGVTVPMGDSLSAYGSVQIPVYQRVNGYQLAPKAILSLGLSYRL
jgi:hypothetical protein